MTSSPVISSWWRSLISSWRRSVISATTSASPRTCISSISVSWRRRSTSWRPSVSSSSTSGTPFFLLLLFSISPSSRTWLPGRSTSRSGSIISRTTPRSIILTTSTSTTSPTARLLTSLLFLFSFSGQLLFNFSLLLPLLPFNDLQLSLPLGILLGLLLSLSLFPGLPFFPLPLDNLILASLLFFSLLLHPFSSPFLNSFLFPSLQTHLSLLSQSDIEFSQFLLENILSLLQKPLQVLIFVSPHPAHSITVLDIILTLSFLVFNSLFLVLPKLVSLL